MPQMINRPFAQNGDKALPPDSDNLGFVSFSQGYTPDYEINLASGNVNAKAVERPIQNALFNLITDNLLWLQTHGFMQWFATQSGGYNINDMVCDNKGTTAAPIWTPYRCRKNGVTSRPISVVPTATNPDWEEVPLPSVARSLIPFQVGKDYINQEIPAAAFIQSGSLNTLTKGFYIAPNTAAVTAITNKPSQLIGSVLPFTIEHANWTTMEGSNQTVYTLQRLVTLDGHIFTRSATNNAWGNWQWMATPEEVQQGLYHIANATGNNTASTLTMRTPLSMFTAGMKVRFIVPASNAGPYLITIGSQISVELLGMDGLSLPPNAIITNRVAEILWDGSKWYLVNCPTGQAVVPTAVADNAAPTWKQVKDLFATALDWNRIYPIGFVAAFGNGFDPNTSFTGTVWQKLPEGKMIRTATAGQTPMTGGGSDTATLATANIPSHSHYVNLGTSTWAAQNLTTTTFDYGTKGTTASGDHVHYVNLNTNVTGDHGHSAWTDVQGQHAHNFQFSYGDFRDNRVNIPNGGSVQSGIINLQTDGQGAHAHNVGIGIAGNHAHNTQGNTNGGGNHAHNVGIGAHNHTVTTPAHYHTVQGDTNATGSGASFSVLNSYIALVAWVRTS